MRFEDKFDLIMALDVLEHIEEDSWVISESCRALKYGGGLIITVPQH
jgi:2-polyprenyl-3-methyl-5-hydroxy-6-metoxy-1,4-benzoquinol methylase